MGGAAGAGFIPHSLPTYVDRARVDWRWQERTKVIRTHRINSKEMIERVQVEDIAQAVADETDDDGFDYAANSSLVNNSSLSKGGELNQSVESDSNSASSNIGGRSMGSLSTSLTAFELLESTRGDLNLNLNVDEMNSISASVKEVNSALHDAIKDTGVRTEGESAMLANKGRQNTERQLSDEIEGRDDEEDDELLDFELDL